MQLTHFKNQIATLATLDLPSPVGVFSNDLEVFEVLSDVLKEHQVEVLKVPCSLFCHENSADEFLKAVSFQLNQPSNLTKKVLVLQDFTAISLNNQMLLEKQLMEGFKNPENNTPCSIFLTGRGAINKCLVDKLLLPFGFVKLSLENGEEHNFVTDKIEAIKHFVSERTHKI